MKDQKIKKVKKKKRKKKTIQISKTSGLEENT